MELLKKQKFVTSEITSLLKAIDPDVRGATYIENYTSAHVIISYKNATLEHAATETIKLSTTDFHGIAKDVINGFC